MVGKKQYNVMLLVLILMVMASFVLNDSAYAGNGTRFLGFSARDSAMAGATTASAADTSVLVRNPAGLVRIGNRIDFEYMNILPHDIVMDPEGVTGAVAGQPLANIGIIQESTIWYLPGGNAGISYRIPDTDEHPISVGCGVFTISGVATNFPSSRINVNIIASGEYDKMIDLRSVRFAPGIAVAFNDKLSFGVTGNIAVQAFRTNNATSTFNLATLTYDETEGGGNWDFAPGGGFTLGLLYKLNDMISLGTSYESLTWMGYHHRYKDLELHLIDGAPVINAGISIKPIKNLELTYDTRFINWTAVKVARLQPIAGGFGWTDQWIFATGGEYTFMDKLKLRLGYNYGKSPIRRTVVFANSLLPLIMEHHLTTGFSYLVTKDLSVDVTWEHHFKAAMSDDGTGDVYSSWGRGTKVTAAAEVISVAMGYNF